MGLSKEQRDRLTRFQQQDHADRPRAAREEFGNDSDYVVWGDGSVSGIDRGSSVGPINLSGPEGERMAR